MNIGFIGLGAMGGPMASNLLQISNKVYVYDTQREAAAALEEKGAVYCSTLKTLAQHCDYILTSLPNGSIVESVMTGEEGIFSSCAAQTTIIDLSSVAPSTSQKLAKLAQHYQLFYLDAPVSGGVAGAKSGTLTFMIGGNKTVYENARPIFDCLGKTCFHVGDVGAGDAMKIINNLLLGCNMAALSEAFTLGKKCGLDPQMMYDIIKVSSGRSYALEAKTEKFILADQYEGGFSINLQHKDLNLALEAAKDTTTPVPMTSSATQIYEVAKTMEYGTSDISALVKVWSDINQL
ncbi:NAD(P)-dependent oxidoreductase [Hespellia stercorisuis]|uniref:2-hydroxymethylglutarate dehydrogenase n=1 Tax=Hespellia stercorisuis DSM 15480 TaxID=1121950 RepID=A0A1M6SM32_9FIRM|nr:NAD(P)-dependent oxidoreductase [Hespellia stercorisuis]SHK45700.1 2-hydroxymethylglutarate dehydrogenase [Hespellia stercorisuis DSM 15480]